MGKYSYAITLNFYFFKYSDSKIIFRFYEWKSDAKLKQPYFVYFHQNECVKWADPSEESEMYESWTGRKPLTIAGIFDISQSGALYSYVIITVDTTPELAFMHDRIPVGLKNRSINCFFFCIAEF